MANAFSVFIYQRLGLLSIFSMAQPMNQIFFSIKNKAKAQDINDILMIN